MEKSLEFFTALFLSVIGLSHILQPLAWVEFFIWLRGKGNVGVFVNGFLTLSFGSFLVSFHNVWEGLPMILTLFGWSQVLKGMVSFIAPQVSLRGLYLISPERLWHFIAGGVFALTLSGVFWYIALRPI